MRVEVARLNHLQTKLLDRIEVGDVPAINAAVRIIMARSDRMSRATGWISPDMYVL